MCVTCVTRVTYTYTSRSDAIFRQKKCDTLQKSMCHMCHIALGRHLSCEMFYNVPLSPSLSPEKTSDFMT